MYSIIKTIYINRKINIGVPEKRKLFGERRKEWSVYYKFLKNLFEHGISFDEA